MYHSALTGKVASGKVSGVVAVNGTKATLMDYRSILGFVPQDDVMHCSLTVQENIMFSARTRLDRNTSEAWLLAHVEQVLRQLDLYEIRHQVIGDTENRGISGGQRKRVNIGIELAANPSILFLDEPTS